LSRNHKTIKGSGTCPVCSSVFKTHASDGTLHLHGPRSSPCPGSNQLPVSASTQHVTGNDDATVTITSDNNCIQSATAVVSSVSSTTSAAHEANHTQSNNDSIQHPVRSGPILQRIPKNARIHVGNLVLQLINDVIRHPTSATCWSRLLGFPSACLAKPSRGGKSRNLTTMIINQVQQYEAGLEQSSSTPSTRRPAQHCNKSVKTSEQQMRLQQLLNWKMVMLKVQYGYCALMISWLWSMLQR
jgi:hypothetical protein